MDFAYIKHAGMGQKEFADLIGVSRVSVNNWIKGKSKPGRHTIEETRKQLELVTAAYKLKYLPADIPIMCNSNVESRKAYIDARLMETKRKIKLLKK
jgi:transcriptional regulator with XRE-family HTH domain|tara:strand:+ start:1690 stop:1980 length:291 start_codon:yes stop_codon:yes gene_type:complete